MTKNIAPVVMWLTIVLVPSRLLAQWDWIQPYPQGNTLISSTAINGTAYFMGESSTVLITSDGGNSWRCVCPYQYPKEIGSYGDVSNCRISFIDSQRGWIARGSGGLYFTTDGGLTWQWKAIFFEHPGMIYFSNSRFGITTGDEYRTTDGGETWQNAPFTQDGDGFFCAFTHTDSLHLWTVSASNFGYGGGKIKHSADGGASWYYRNNGLRPAPDTSYNLIAIHINPSGLGIVTGYAQPKSGSPLGIILRTTNWGGSWTRIDDDHTYHTVLSVSDSIWVILGEVFKRSTDAGRTWQVVCPATAAKTGVWVPEQKVLLAGGLNGAIYRSTDLGANWTCLWSAAKAVHDIALSYVPQRNTSYGYGVGDWSTLMRSTDRGNTWIKDSIGACYPYYLLTVDAKDNTVWAGGAGRALVRSSDYGFTWDRIATPLDSIQYSGYVINDCDIYDSLRCIVSATLPNYFNIITHLLYTNDGGSKWKHLSFRRGLMIESVSLPGPQYVVVGGRDWTVFTNGTGFVFRSTDAGQTWDSTFFTNPVEKLLMFNPREGLAVTYDKLYRTSDGGKKWYEAALSWKTGSPYFGSLIGLGIPSEKSNMALGYLASGTGSRADYIPPGFVYSTDKGKTWVKTTVQPPNQDAGNAIASADGIPNIFVGGENGGFVRKISPTTVAYEPPEPNRLPPTGVFVLSTDSLPSGINGVRLSWTSDEADEAWIDHGIGSVAPNGSIALDVGATTKFTLTLKNQWGQKSYSSTVHVEAPLAFNVLQNYPNPFNASTTIQFSIPTEARVTIEIFNILGEEVATLKDDQLIGGVYSVVWNAAANPSGVYLCRVHAGSNSQVRKLLLLK